MQSPPLLTLALALLVGGSAAYGQTVDTAPVTNEQSLKAGRRTLVQIRILGLNHVKEEAVRTRLRAREWAPYSPEDKALDTAALLATGEFVSVQALEVDLSSSAFRLDIAVTEASPVTQTAVSTEAAPTAAGESFSSPAVPVAPPAAGMPKPTWIPKPYVRTAPTREPGAFGPPWVVGDIAVTGNRHVKLGVIRSQIKARKGDIYDRPDLDRDIQTLVGMGNFERVAADVSPMADQPVPERLLEAAGSTSCARLTLLVEERPLVRKIRYEGQREVSKGRLSDAATLKEKDPLDRLRLKEDAAKMLQVYHEKGYIGAKVEPRVAVDTAAATADVTYAVEEGPRTRIGLVRLDGLRAFRPRKVLKQMSNRRKKTYQHAKLEEDLQKIETLYKNNGYLDFTVIHSTTTFSEDRSSVTIVLALEEGRQYRFGTTAFSGNTVFPAAQLAKAVEYRRGNIFNQEKFDATIRNIQQDFYAEKGYLRARPVPEKTFNEATGEMDARFDIAEGNIVYMDHVDVEGNRATKTHVLKREILLKPGDPFRTSRLKKSQERVMNLGFIEDIQLDFQSPTDPDKLDLTFDVTEGKPGMLTAGAGFSSLDGLIGTLSMQHLNLFGRAQRASVAWSFGARVQDYSVSWKTLWLRESPTSLGLSVFNTRRINPFESSSAGFITKRLGGTITLGPRFQDDKYQLDFSYTFQQIGLANVQTQFLDRLSEGTSVSSSFGIELARDTRDYFLDPSKGTRHAVGAAMTGGPFMGDIHFFKPYLSDAAHFTLARANDWPLVLTFANRAGYVTQFGETKGVPPFDRFFLGGQDTLRGYSPTGEVGHPGGGKVYDVFNIELGFPLARERKKSVVKLVAFFDAGTAWDNMRAARLRIGSGERDIKTDAGFGLRFVTPAFPIRLDYGYGFNHRPGERLYQINFGIGSLF